MNYNSMYLYIKNDVWIGSNFLQAVGIPIGVDLSASL
jgi:hypothetical protein